MPGLVAPTERAMTTGKSRPCTAGNLRGRLRTATAAAHARLDAQLGRLDLRRLRDYRGFLEMHAAVVPPLEAALARSGVERLFPDWAVRSRTNALRDDLFCLGGTERAASVVPRLDEAGILGAMYVLEGSRLGARFLLRTVLDSDDPAVTGATEYLRHGEGLPLWPSFLALIERHAGAPDDASRAIGAARYVFDLFESQAASLDASLAASLAAAPASAG
jgi:heme oxygenase